MRLLGRGFYTHIKNVLFSSSTDVRSHNPPSFGAQHPRWHTARCLALIPFVIAQAHHKRILSALARYTSPSTSRFYNTSTRERFLHPYKECFVPLSNRCGISQSTLLRGPASSLAHRPVFGSDTICNSPSIPQTDIVRFGPLRIAVNLMILQHVY